MRIRQSGGERGEKAVQAEGTTSGNGLDCSRNIKFMMLEQMKSGEARGDSGATFSRAAGWGRSGGQVILRANESL